MKTTLITIIQLLSLCQLAHLTDNQPFECFVCNKDPQEDDSVPCVDRVERCPPNVTSCSAVAFRNADGKTRVRKFCTSPGVPIYQYLMLFPGSSMCQNIEAESTLLCVCTKPKCNAGTYREVMEKTMLSNFGDDTAKGSQSKRVDLSLNKEAQTPPIKFK